MARRGDGDEQALTMSTPPAFAHSKTAMEKALADEKVDITDSKIWDPQRQYEKRLVTLMAKRTPVASAAAAKAAGATPRSKAAAAAAADPSDDLAGEEDYVDMGGDVDMASAPPVESTPARPRPRPRAGAVAGSSNGAKRGGAARRERSESALTELSDGEGDDGGADFATAAAATRASHAMDEDEREEEEDSDDAVGSRRKRADSVLSVADSLPEVTSKRRRLVVD